jgi:hypothetical protein
MIQHTFVLEMLVHDRQRKLCSLLKACIHGWEEYKQEERKYRKPFPEPNFFSDSFITEWVRYVESEFKHIISRFQVKKDLERLVLAECMKQLDDRSHGLLSEHIVWQELDWI